MSSVSVFSSSSKDFAWLQQQMSSAYMNFREDVAGRSLVYMLKSVGAKTDPCGRPFDCSLHLLVSSPMWTRILLSRNMNPTTSATQKGRAFASFRRRPVCQTVSYAAVRSSSTAPVFIFLWKPFSNEGCQGQDLVARTFCLVETLLGRPIEFPRHPESPASGWGARELWSRPTVMRSAYSSRQSEDPCLASGWRWLWTGAIFSACCVPTWCGIGKKQTISLPLDQGASWIPGRCCRSPLRFQIWYVKEPPTLPQGWMGQFLRSKHCGIEAVAIHREPAFSIPCPQELFLSWSGDWLPGSPSRRIVQRLVVVGLRQVGESGSRLSYWSGWSPFRP